MAYTTIKKPSDYFNTKLYTGNGSTNAITGVGFQPDWTWIKNRTDASNHNLYDAVRGTSAGKLKSNTTNAESYNASDLSSFNTDGFTVGGNNEVNGSGDAMASWNWLGANGTAANTDGSISSTVSANTTSGFSIVSYTGTGSAGTVGHGLGTTPSMVIVKNRSEVYAWNCYHQSLGATKYILLNASDASATGTTWNDTAPTSSVFSIGSTSGVNKNTNNLIAYCFAEKQGFSKFGSYTGNGSTDGTFTYLGFKPAFLLYKNASNNFTNWQVHDSKRSTYNLSVNRLNPNDSSVELGTTADSFDFLSNGFKARATASNSNTSGSTYIYMAFAEQPLVGDNPATAR